MKDIKSSHNSRIISNNISVFRKLILENIDNSLNLLSFLERYFNLENKNIHVVSTSSIFNIKSRNVCGIVNLKKINSIRYINKFFESVNHALSNSELYLGCVETYPNRKKAIKDKYPYFINNIVYFFDMLFKRVFPKLIITKQIYFYLTKGKNRVISRAETYGRLYSCGFEIVDEINHRNLVYFIAKKVKNPSFDIDPTYGPIIRLKRVGKDNVMFNVYKLRTMHPFSEYLQDYVYKQNKLEKGGKFKNDFRISPEGRFFRKLWLDELPMLLNLFKGDVKLVGVRPLSSHYFNLYSMDLQKKRVKYKPGLIPPFYADLPKTLNEIMSSELKYLEAYEKAPFITDLKYFLLAFKNIFWKGARSQ